VDFKDTYLWTLEIGEMFHYKKRFALVLDHSVSWVPAIGWLYFPKWYEKALDSW